MSTPKKMSASKLQKKISLQKKRKIVQPKPIQQKRWKSLELIGVLTFLNENFDTWHKNHLDACSKAVKATNVSRETKAIYYKIHTMIKDMKEYLRSGKKSTSNSIIWEEEKIYDLVKEMYDKTKEKKNSERNRETSSDEDVEMIINDEVTTETSTSRQQVYIPLSFDVIKDLYLNKFNYINELRTKLNEKIEGANNLFEESNVRIFYSTERTNNICDEKVQKLIQLRSELNEILETAYDKYEEMKNFQ